MPKKTTMTMAAVFAVQLPDTLPTGTIKRVKKLQGRTLIWNAVTSHFRSLQSNAILPQSANDDFARKIMGQLHRAQTGSGRVTISALEARQAADAFITVARKAVTEQAQLAKAA